MPTLEERIQTVDIMTGAQANTITIMDDRHMTILTGNAPMMMKIFMNIISLIQKQLLTVHNGMKIFMKKVLLIQKQLLRPFKEGVK